VEKRSRRSCCLFSDLAESPAPASERPRAVAAKSWALYLSAQPLSPVAWSPLLVRYRDNMHDLIFLKIHQRVRERGEYVPTSTRDVFWPTVRRLENYSNGVIESTESVTGQIDADERGPLTMGWSSRGQYENRPFVSRSQPPMPLQLLHDDGGSSDEG
jgi:hypothetical protein